MMDIILTSYFNTLPDNQRGKHWRGNEISVLYKLYHSVRRLKLTMKVFHDHLSEKFIIKYSDHGISFKSYVPEGNVLSARWGCFYDYIEQTDFDKYLCIDCGDTEIFKDPFPIIGDLVIGSEPYRIGSFPWLDKKLISVYGDVLYPGEQVLNCGILGGSRKAMLKVLKRFLEEAETTGNKEQVDMAIFNKIMREFDYKTGFPIHTEFGKYKNDAYIRHK